MFFLEYFEEIVYSIVSIPLFAMSIKKIKEDISSPKKIVFDLLIHIGMAIIFGFIIICGITIIINKGY